MTLKVDPKTDALLIVDLQPTFFPADPGLPGSGELPVPNAPAVIDPINRLIALFSWVTATRDTHPPDHLSFASQYNDRRPFDRITTDDLPHLRPTAEAPAIDTAILEHYLRRVGAQTLWPDHAREYTPGAELHPALDRARLNAVVTKGEHRYYDSYSAFFDNGHFAKTRLDDMLRVRGYTRLFITGLALDVCVCYTALDARSLEYDVVVVEDACAAIDQPEGTAEAAWQMMTEAGVVRARAADIEKGPPASL